MRVGSVFGCGVRPVLLVVYEAVLLLVRSCFARGGRGLCFRLWCGAGFVRVCGVGFK